MSVSQELKTKHLLEFESVIKGLSAIGGATAPPAPTPEMYIGSISNAFCSLLLLCMSSLDKKPRVLDLNDDQWSVLMTVVHRSFYSSMQSAIEGGLKEICDNRRQAISGRNPFFKNYFEAALLTSRMDNKRKDYWTDYFKGFSVLRNKASHFDTNFTSKQKKCLIKADLGHHINSQGSMHTNIKNYLPIMIQVLDFLKEV